MLTRQAPRETRRSPMALMVRLPTQHREIIVATYFSGRTTREAAWVLGLAPAVAKARLYQAMRDLSHMVAAGQPDHAGHKPADSSESH
jgi:DNA-directed RNA polymerase specialized sigma24 family protein